MLIGLDNVTLCARLTVMALAKAEYPFAVNLSAHLLVSTKLDAMARFVNVATPPS
jgi:hypothetical protein